MRKLSPEMLGGIQGHIIREWQISFYSELVVTPSESPAFLSTSIVLYSSAPLYCSLKLLLRLVSVSLKGNLSRAAVLSFFFFINLFYFWLHWVFVAAHRLSLAAVSRGHSSLRCAGFSLWRLLLLRSMGFRRVGFSGCGMQAQ